MRRVIGFWLLAVVLIASAVFTISQKSPVYSVVGLLVNFIALAALYFTLNAEFIGVIQIIVYSGAILMLFVFVIALLSSGIGPFAEGPNRLPGARWPALGATLVAFGSVVYAIARASLATSAVRPLPVVLGSVGEAGAFGSVGNFGVALFTANLLPFEITAFILMVAVVGVVMIAGDAAPQRTRHLQPRRKAREREPIVKAGRP